MDLEKIIEALAADDKGDDIRAEYFSLGLPIYYAESGKIIQEDPDGKKWIVTMDENRKITKVQAWN